MDYFINLSEFCGNINLSAESAMFFIDEGIICVEKRENEFYIDEKAADDLIIISEIKNELGINDEGVSVILNLRKKIIDYQNMLSTVFDAVKTSKSIDELIFLMERSESFKSIITNLKEF
ncbi:MAG: chaperone modulator CbpM [bacterium]